MITTTIIIVVVVVVTITIVVSINITTTIIIIIIIINIIVIVTITIVFNIIITTTIIIIITNVIIILIVTTTCLCADTRPSAQRFLQKVFLPIVPLNQCQTAFRDTRLISDIKICAGDLKNGGIDSCLVSPLLASSA